MRLQLLLVVVVVILYFSLSHSQQCKDNIQGCARIWCRYYPDVLAQCPKTCGMCTATTTTTTTTTPDPNSWSTCSRSCDSGTRSRTRMCGSRPCGMEYQDCNIRACPRVNCGRNKARYNSLSSCCTLRQSDTCGNNALTTRRVIGGTRSMPFQWPWMIRLEMTLRSGQTSVCGAVLINTRWAITAGHCVENVQANKITAFVGYGTARQREATVESFIQHPSYDFPANDIALLKFKSAVTIDEFAMQLCLPRGERTKDDIKCYIAGWGSVSNNPLAISPTLQEARVRILPYGVCREAYKSQPFASKLNENTQICAGSISGDVDSCLGDSGGPIMCQRCSSCSWYMAGVVSIGPVNCGTPDKPGIYTRVIAYESWIERNAGRSQSGRFNCS